MSTGVFASKPQASAGGRKIFKDPLALRETTPAVHRSHSANQHNHNEGNLAVDLRPKEGAPVQKPTLPRGRVEGKHLNRSRCPWQPAELSARQERAGRRCNGPPEQKPRQRGKGHFPISTNTESKPVEEHVHRKKTNPTKLLWQVETEEKPVYRPSKRMTEASQRRSASAEQPAPGRRLVRTPSVERRTALWGDNPDLPRQRPEGVRMVRTPSQESLNRTPYATTLDLNPSNSMRPVPAEPKLASMRSGSAKAPYDTDPNPAAPADVGTRTGFRPQTRHFSRHDSFDRIFGGYPTFGRN